VLGQSANWGWVREDAAAAVNDAAESDKDWGGIEDDESLLPEALVEVLDTHRFAIASQFPSAYWSDKHFDADERGLGLAAQWLREKVANGTAATVPCWLNQFPALLGENGPYEIVRLNDPELDLTYDGWFPYWLDTKILEGVFFPIFFAVALGRLLVVEMGVSLLPPRGSEYYDRYHPLP